MKLLHKTLKSYIVFSVIIFAVSVPVFYFLVQNLWIEDVDETLIYHKEQIVINLKNNALDDQSVIQFSKMLASTNSGILISKISKNLTETDSIYNNQFYDDSHQHVEPFRELKSVVKINNRWYQIIVRKDLVESEDLIEAIVITQASMFLLFLIGMMVLNSYFSRKTWKPFYHIVSKLQSYKIDHEQEIETTNSDIEEFNILEESIQELTRNNIQIFKVQKEFTENAAHETQTPLAVIKNQIDLLAQDQQLNSNQAEIINKINKHISLLTRLNRNLLLLSKIENSQFKSKDSLQLSALIYEVYEMFEDHLLLKNIRFIDNISEIEPILSNKQLIQSLLINLFTNAIKYNIDEGEIEVSLTANLLSITNTGTAEALDKNKIFERFYKQSNQEESVGLGLAIVKKICDNLGYEIHYQYTIPNRHSFLIHF